MEIVFVCHIRSFRTSLAAVYCAVKCHWIGWPLVLSVLAGLYVQAESCMFILDSSSD